MKRVAWPAGAVALALAGWLAPPAQAASYTIQGPKLFVASSALWAQSGCNTDYVGSPANGVDSRVIDIAGRPAGPMLITWSGTKAADVLVNNSMSVSFVSGGCQPRPITNAMTQAPGGWLVNVPHDARWMLVENNGFVNVTLNV